MVCNSRFDNLVYWLFFLDGRIGVLSFSLLFVLLYVVGVRCYQLLFWVWGLALPSKIKYQLDVIRWASSFGKTIPKDVVVYHIIPFCNVIVNIDIDHMSRSEVMKTIYCRGTGRLAVCCFRRLKLSIDREYSPNYSETLKLYSIPFTQITYIHIDCPLQKGFISTNLKRALMSAPNLRELRMPDPGSGARFPEYKLLVMSVPHHCVINLGSLDGICPKFAVLRRNIFTLIDPARTESQLITFQREVLVPGTMYHTVSIEHFVYSERGKLVEFKIKYPPYVMAKIKELISGLLTSELEKLFEMIGKPETIVFENWAPLPSERKFCDDFGIVCKHIKEKPKPSTIKYLCLLLFNKLW